MSPNLLDNSRHISVADSLVSHPDMISSSAQEVPIIGLYYRFSASTLSNEGFIHPSGNILKQCNSPSAADVEYCRHDLNIRGEKVRIPEEIHRLGLQQEQQLMFSDPIDCLQVCDERSLLHLLANLSETRQTAVSPTRCQGGPSEPPPDVFSVDTIDAMNSMMNMLGEATEMSLAAGGFATPGGVAPAQVENVEVKADAKPDALKTNELVARKPKRKAQMSNINNEKAEDIAAASSSSSTSSSNFRIFGYIEAQMNLGECEVSEERKRMKVLESSHPPDHTIKRSRGHDESSSYSQSLGTHDTEETSREKSDEDDLIAGGDSGDCKAEPGILFTPHAVSKAATARSDVGKIDVTARIPRVVSKNRIKPLFIAPLKHRESYTANNFKTENC